VLIVLRLDIEFLPLFFARHLQYAIDALEIQPSFLRIVWFSVSEQIVGPDADFS